MDPLEERAPPPPSAPTGRKSALAFLAALLALLPPALFAQQASPVVGLAATQLAVFLLPALVATAGSNLRLAPYLRLRAPRRAPVVPGPPYLWLPFPRLALVVLGALTGAGAYLVAGTVMAVTQALFPRGWVETFDVARIFEGPARERWALALLAALAAPVCEELTFRGYVQTTLSLRHRPAAAVTGSAVLFAALHLDPVRFPALVLLGLLFGWLTWRTGSIWPAVAAHATNNGIAAALLLALGPPEGHALPSAAELLGTFGIGLALLAGLAAGIRALAPTPPSPSEALLLADPSSPSIAWRPGRVPPALAAAAMAGAASLVALGIAGLVRPR